MTIAIVSYCAQLQAITRLGTEELSQSVLKSFVALPLLTFFFYISHNLLLICNEGITFVVLSRKPWHSYSQFFWKFGNLTHGLVAVVLSLICYGRIKFAAFFVFEKNIASYFFRDFGYFLRGYCKPENYILIVDVSGRFFKCHICHFEIRQIYVYKIQDICVSNVLQNFFYFV